MRIKTFLSALFILVSAFFSSTPAIGNDNKAVVITKGVWSTGVGGDKQPSDELIDAASDVEQLYFWTLVQGNKSALNILETKGKLPIRHKWYRYYGVTPSVEGNQVPTDAININVGKMQTLGKLRSEINKTGHFNWRTWSMKQNITPGLWIIKVVYADGSSVYCEDLDAACEYKIIIN